MAPVKEEPVLVTVAIGNVPGTRSLLKKTP